ncbi:N-acetylglucosamine-6-phosphate deacetylase [Arthrobacter livingstonensis]|uniref:N-acetylglucosamine-6-phosphate deacetylase n=1 Tax=Arthrobacter livingstonensis TaxID=670078 RepID=A0A2V5LCU3_9MICC|nr:amidohydrolase family protein [Arthrobacter livingstonensis]PYI68702.1 N-acetylglucosamine-6-phosphate deacetylase [Arthrobacter livingstonensis]
MTDPNAAPGPAEPAKTLILGPIVTDHGLVEDGLLAVEGDRIVYSGRADHFDEPGFTSADLDPANLITLPAGHRVIPGLVDIHNHGGNGGDFPSGDEASARTAVEFLHRAGTTTLLASMVTASAEDLLKGIGVYAKMTGEGLLAGIHLEGPFLSHARCGAQNPAFLLDPDLVLAAALIEAGQGAIATMTYAPELPGAAELVDLLTAHGVTPSVGHTDCDSATAAESLAQARDGLDSTGFDGVSGRPTVTHLFNGMPPMHHRSPGPVAACLRAAKAGHAAVELVADNTHLDPETVKTVFSLVGAANIALVTDSMAAAGLADGQYMLGPSPVTVAGGVATLDATGSIAGGTATLLDVVRRTVGAGVKFTDALLSATVVPAEVLGLTDELGSLRRGLRADALIVADGLELQRVMRAGEWLN